ncbi:MAG: 16S rRNA (adenine(1518)-N(6)/adenine(1519)-N(6))-dimethyltransferase RsmA [Chitinispirillaceae bacterium]|jgi:16S rRNA (adenine1518-N6/adenine1519-N6)-dimethyltransferase|nr:16S rRNA (adenine(1518)-N(6)/adenine(1519)-N(6))-dimethyltransferase RsmA [Chitinispirillaceae bacterium]
MNRHGPKKHLGQHFLTAPSFARKIAEVVPAGADEHVLEIGPGRGALSIFLKQRFSAFHCIEIDRDVIDCLAEKLGAGEYTIHHADVLKFDYGKAGFPLHVVGNLPYSIGAMIIRKTLLYGNRIKSFTFMVQREVAERIVSPPHQKSNGFLSIFCQFFGEPRILFRVPPGAFFPPPKVDSAVVHISIDNRARERLPEQQWEQFFAFFSTAFGKRRKMLPNTLCSKPDERERAVCIMGAAGIDPRSRPEDLGVNEWLDLYKRWVS